MTKNTPGSHIHRLPTVFWLLLLLGCTAGCNNTEQKPPEVVVVKIPEKIDEKIKELLPTTLAYVKENNGKLNDSVTLRFAGLADTIYGMSSYQPVWSSNEAWTTLADSLYAFISDCRLYGLFPSDYNYSSLSSIRRGMAADSLHKKNAAMWARADIIFTDAYLGMAHDLSLGRLAKDSITQRNDSLYNDTFYIRNFQAAIAQKNVRSLLEQLEPKLRGYVELKSSIPAFLDSASFAKTTYIVYPNKDSALLMQQVAARLTELNYPVKENDSTSLRQNIRKYQQEHAIPVTGKIGEKTTSSLNNTDLQKFRRIAVNLDRYKLMADTLPHQYLWVNLPAFYLQLWNDDTLALQSKIVVGKPLTRTPLLTSKITDMVTYPQWTIPESIIAKEVLPGLQKDTNYLRKKGYSLINDKGDEVYASSVKWSKYKKGIPYKVVQGSGDDNALGILKFNFGNKYSVYLHDTNQRYYFDKSFRALSHGCVRVQQWNKLAHFLISNDSLNAAPGVNTFKSDSLKAWLSRKEKHSIGVRTKLPLYIRYFGCAGVDGKVKFYEDIYNEDKMLIDRYFANKGLN
ncbi:MAG TPA: L,D-transpeptidase family protein [Chitinophagaceae bacterium]|nr:L,D-transpeptidase family protein [Chitinophagaceae bacterium]